MESWEVLEKAIPRAASGRVAQLLGVGADYVRKWRREPESEDAPTASGHRSILDRICNLLDAVFLVNPSGAGLIVNHIIEHHQGLIETHALPFTSDGDRARSVSHLLTEATEAINRLNLEGCTDETLRELVELRDAAATTIIQVQRTMTDESGLRDRLKERLRTQRKQELAAIDRLHSCDRATLPTLEECRQFLGRSGEQECEPALGKECRDEEPAA